ncbi:MAG: ribonuclease R [Chlorobiaceae bacterium]|nr:ribonuclease R [Chlorobiaceae bacterium]
MARQRNKRKPKPAGPTGQPVQKGQKAPRSQKSDRGARKSTQISGERVRPNDHILINEFLFRRGESSLASEIINFFSDLEGGRFRSLEIATMLGYTESWQLPGFWYVLHKLQEEGVVDKDSNRCYGLSGTEPATYEDLIDQTKQFPADGKERYKVNQSYTGKIVTHPNGYGFVDVEGFDDDVFIKAGDLNSAIHGDEVELVVTKVPETYTKKSTPHERCEGIIMKVISRRITTIVGTLIKSNRRFTLKPDERKILPEIVVPVKNAAKAVEGSKVLVGELDFSRDGVIQAKVLEVLGKAGESNVEVSAIARSKGIDETFDKALTDFAASIREGITDKDLEGRLDMRGKTVFTIDPVDAKDFDDALSVEVLDEGLYSIGVHIADVSHYVPENSPLDREALKRATSVYLVDRVIPMLPARLSEQVCSLNPGVDRMAYSVFFTMGADGEIRKHEFHKTVIHSKRRFTYEDVEQVLKSGEGDYVAELQLLERLSILLREKRFSHGGLDFETEEVRFRLGKDGEPLEVMKKERLGSHRLIEEFMLLANRKVAEYLTKTFKAGKKEARPVIYRVHDGPQQEKVLILANFVKRLGFDLKINRAKEGPIVSARSLRQLLQQVKGSNIEFLVNELVLRCMSKAVYTGENAGHFGLGFEHYTHFTSPIRRYPDLLVHRLLFEYEGLRKKRGRISAARIKELDEKIRTVSQISNEREKSAVEAERESIKLKQVEYMASHVGKVYPGVISGATDYGIYVRLVDFAIEGMVHMRNLTDDYYEFDEATYSLIGKRRKKKLQIGKRLKVKVHSVDIERRTIDLAME